MSNSQTIGMIVTLLVIFLSAFLVLEIGAWFGDYANYLYGVPIFLSALFIIKLVKRM